MAAASRSGAGVDAGASGTAALGLAGGVRAILAGPGISEKPMFGGLCFLIDGKLVASDDLAAWIADAAASVRTLPAKADPENESQLRSRRT